MYHCQIRQYVKWTYNDHIYCRIWQWYIYIYIYIYIYVPLSDTAI